MGHSPRPPADSAVRAVISPVVEAQGLDLEDLDVQAAGRRRRVCVVVDRDGGMDLDSLAEISRALSDALDSADAMGDATYTLEVTSPGVDRPLTLPRHWRRNIGRRVRVLGEDGTVVEGRVKAADDEGVTLAVDVGSKPESAERHVPWQGVRQGEVQVEFRRPATPGDDSKDDSEQGEEV